MIVNGMWSTNKFDWDGNGMYYLLLQEGSILELAKMFDDVKQL